MTTESLKIYPTLREANVARQADWCPEQAPDLSFRGVELAGEAGEACEALIVHAAELGKLTGRAANVIKKLERERHGWRGSRDTKEHLAEELADVWICADLAAITAGIDLDEAVIAKFNATSEKVGLPHRLKASAMNATALAGPGNGGDVGASLRWALDEIDALSNKLCGFGYPQGMAQTGRLDQRSAYVSAVQARRPHAASPSRQESGEQAVRIAGGAGLIAWHWDDKDPDRKPWSYDRADLIWGRIHLGSYSRWEDESLRREGADLTRPIHAWLVQASWIDGVYNDKPDGWFATAEEARSFVEAETGKMLAEMGVLFASVPQPAAPEGTVGGEPGEGMSDEEAIAHLDAAFARKSIRIGTIPYPPAQAGGDEIVTETRWQDPEGVLRIERVGDEIEAVELVDALIEAQRVVGVTDWRAPYYRTVADKRDAARKSLARHLAFANSSARDEALEEAVRIADSAFATRGEVVAAIRALRSSTPTKATPGPAEYERRCSFDGVALDAAVKVENWYDEKTYADRARRITAVQILITDLLVHATAPHPSKTEPRQDGDREVRCV